MFDKLLSLDRELLIYINSLGSETYDSFWLLVTKELNWIPFFLVILILIFFKIERRQFFRLVITITIILLLVLFLTEGIKELVQRPRPSQEPSLQGVLRILKRPTNYSFFSGHASTSFSIATLLWLFLRKRVKWIGVFFIWPLLFSFSRMYLGLHYPTDILTGMMVGSAIGYLAYRLTKGKFLVKQLG